jgi:hypothetical protein
MKKRLLFIIGMLLCFSVSVNAITWTTLDNPVPGASNTHITDIDGSNIVGSFDLTQGSTTSTYGFLYNGTTWTTLNFATTVYGIDGSRLVGYYLDDDGGRHGFFYDGSTRTTLDFPGARTYTYIKGIDGNNLVGSADGHGVIYNLGSQTWTTLDFPGANDTQINSIDGSNLVGVSYIYHLVPPDSKHGFFYDGSTLTTLDYPGALSASISDIDGDNIVGNYSLVHTYNSQGFLYDGTTYTTLNFPGAINTFLDGIDEDHIVGWYHDASGDHGFFATIPEPATIALFALGGLILRKRRV